MNWLLISISAYFLNAIASLIDKILLKKSIPEPVVYTFYVGVLSILAFVLIPFGFQYPGFNLLVISLTGGLIFISALFVLFSLLKKEEASRIIPLVGGMSIILIFFLTQIFGLENLSGNQILSFFIIFLGGFLISQKKNKLIEISNQKTFFLGFLSALFFAIFYVLSKFIYLHHPFISGFLWLRIGSLLGALIIFLIPESRKKILIAIKRQSAPVSKIFFLGQGCGATSFLLINYAISLSSVSLVSVLQGAQYGFLFLMTIIFSRKFPCLLEEDLTTAAIIQKIISIILISLGIFILFSNQ